MDKQSDTLETTEPVAAESPNKIQRIAALLRGEPDVGGDADAGAGSGDDPPDGSGEPETEKPAAPKNIGDLAETLGVGIDELYAIEFRDGTEGKGKAHTLGELKDLLAKETDYTGRELAFAERKVSEENELLRARQELQYILSNLPKGSVSKALQQSAAVELERVSTLEEKRTLHAIPEWKNTAAREKDLDGMAAFIQQYGFGPGDMDRVIDHRWRKMIRDSWTRAERVRSALEKVQEEKPKPAGKPAGTGARPARVTVGPSSSRQDKVAAISQLLRGAPKK